MESLQEKIAKRAYELFLARGGQHGYHIQDWAQAEREILADEETNKKKAKVKEEPIVKEPVKAVEAPVKEPEVEKKAEPQIAKSAPVPAKKKVTKKKTE